MADYYGSGGGRQSDNRRGGRRPDWICSRCNATVFGSRDACYKCNEPKGDAQDAPSDGGYGNGNRYGGGGGRAKDWICDSCNARVFGSKSSCFKCNEPKGDSQDAPDDGGYGNRNRGGRANDWICNRCEAKVFGSRDTCFKCNEPKGDAIDA